MIEEKELNEKLAKWAGWRQLPLGKRGFHYEGTVRLPNWIAPEYTNEQYYMSRSYPPNFTNSLDACFKWLVPKLDYYCLTPEDNSKGYYAEVLIGEDYAEYFQAKTQALALCRAIEKLIDEH